MRVNIILWSALIAAAMATSVHAQEDVRFDIVRFQVDGNSLLPQARVNELVGPFLGRKRVYGDVQKALEALENAYRKAGYGTVQVFVPEQELAGGVVRLVVTESVVGKVTLTGNKHFSEANVRNGLPALQEGKAPNMRELSENIQLSNENPAKQLEVTLGIAEEEGKVNAKINVTDEDPHRFIVTVDNTGTDNTGRHRIGLAYQNANLFDSDQVLTLAVTGAPDIPRDRDMAVASIAYRVPFYSIGDSLDFAYGKSNVNTPVAQATGLNIVGKGEVFALRWNHYLPRAGEYTSRVVVGYDHKNVETCVGVVCSKLLIQPASIAYVGQRLRAGEMLDYNISAATGTAVSNAVATPSVNFTAYRLSTSYLRVLGGEWAARAAFSGQYAGARVPDVEKFGVVGGTAVRGFFERALSGDSGYFMNFELYTPEYAKTFNLPGSLKFVGFIDLGQGYNYATNLVSDAASWGMGFRYGLNKDVALRADVAHVLSAGPSIVGARKEYVVGSGDSQVAPRDLRGHFSLQITF
jgi:hemolysin activation/secretion protein